MYGAVRGHAARIHAAANAPFYSAADAHIRGGTKSVRHARAVADSRIHLPANSGANGYGHTDTNS